MNEPIVQNGLYYENNGAITVEAPSKDCTLTVGEVVVNIPKGWTVTVSKVKSPEINLLGMGSHCVDGELDSITVTDEDGESLIVNGDFDNKEW